MSEEIKNTEQTQENPKPKFQLGDLVCKENEAVRGDYIPYEIISVSILTEKLRTHLVNECGFRKDSIGDVCYNLGTPLQNIKESNILESDVLETDLIPTSEGVQVAKAYHESKIKDLKKLLTSLSPPPNNV